jgi:hypothetical protein
MVVGHQRFGRRISGCLHKKEFQEVSIKDPLSATREATHRIAVVAVAEAEACILLDLHIACTTTATQIIKPKLPNFP